MGWGREIARGDFSSLPYTCVLDLIEARGRVHERLPLYDGLADAEAMGGYLGLSREMVRINTKRAIAAVRDVNKAAGDWLQMAYDASKAGGKR